MSKLFSVIVIVTVIVYTIVMSLRTAKQIIYGAFYLIFLGAVISTAYFFLLKPEPSCFDNKQTQNEKGVDCGGICSKECLPQGLRPLELVDRILTFKTSPGKISALARVGNPNQEHAAKSFSYSFVFYNSGREEIKSFSGRSFIYAGEAKYVLLPNVEPGADFSRLEFHSGDYDWVAEEFYGEAPILEISGVGAKIDGRSIVVEGRILNNDTIAVSEVTLLAIMRNNQGNIVGASQTEIDGVFPNETKSFSII